MGQLGVEPKRPPARGRRLRGIIKWALLSFGALLAAGMAYQWIGTAVDARRFPPPGRLVDVAGVPLHILCMGEGSPTVVLDTLSGGMSPYWGWVQPEVADVTRVCAYDRAGRAWSGAAPAVGLAQGVESYHALLVNAGESPPYVWVGHSIGGLYAQVFAITYPQEVAGVVFVDASHPAQRARYAELAEAERAFYTTARFFPWLARIGIARLYFDLGGTLDMGDLPPHSFAEAASWWSSTAYFESLLDEIRLSEANFAHAHAVQRDLGDLPVAVVTAGHEVFDGWHELQDDLAGLSTNSLHVVVDEADHASLAFHPVHARETVAAILQVVIAARDGGPVAR